MKIVIPGGSGQIGTLLARALVADRHEVVVLSRSPEKASWRVIPWNAETLGDWAAEIDGADAVINLAGRSVNCRYNAKNRRVIKESRIRSTRAVGQAISEAAQAPRVWLQASTATIYSNRFDAPNDEATGILGGSEPGVPDTWKFSIDVARSWEEAANEAIVPQTRKVLLRSAMTMTPDGGGVFDVLAGLARWGTWRSQRKWPAVHLVDPRQQRNGSVITRNRERDGVRTAPRAAPSPRVRARVIERRPRPPGDQASLRR
jgi:uncharacterized protein